jgi:hypothetical protein
MVCRNLCFHHGASIIQGCPGQQTARALHMNDELRIRVGKSGKFRLIQIHYEKFIGWRQFRLFTGEFAVKVADVLAAFLETEIIFGEKFDFWRGWNEEKG